VLSREKGRADVLLVNVLLVSDGVVVVVDGWGWREGIGAVVVLSKAEGVEVDGCWSNAGGVEVME
jgi:hypothetical protein